MHALAGYLYCFELSAAFQEPALYQFQKLFHAKEMRIALG